MKRTILHTFCFLVLGGIVFVYIGCGAAAAIWLRDSNDRGLDCIYSQLTDLKRPRLTIPACLEWDQRTAHEPWYVRLYAKAVGDSIK